MANISSRVLRLVWISFLVATTPEAAKSTASLHQHIFRFEPSAALVVRLGDAWNDDSSYHYGAVKEIGILRELPLRTKLMMTPLLPLPSGASLDSSEQILKRVQQSAALNLVDQSVEKKVVATQRHEGEADLFFVTSTDRNPKPGEF